MHAYASMYWSPVFFKYSWMLLSWIKLNQAEWSWIWVQLRWSKCYSLGFWRLVSCETYVRESVKFGISTGPAKSMIFQDESSKIWRWLFFIHAHIECDQKTMVGLCELSEKSPDATGAVRRLEGWRMGRFACAWVVEYVSMVSLRESYGWRISAFSRCLQIRLLKLIGQFPMILMV